jgi:hypothetical protein
MLNVVATEFDSEKDNVGKLAGRVAKEVVEAWRELRVQQQV